MKRTIGIISLVITLLVSCKDYLKEDPRGSISVDQYFNTYQEALSAVYGIYADFTNSDQYDENGVTQYLNMGVDQTVMARPVPGTFNYAVYNLDPSNGQVLAFWQALYGTIKDANLVINRISVSQLDDSEKATLVGEAKFLRALPYYILATCWGDVPFWTSELQIDKDSKLGSTPANEILDSLISDLEEAKKVLPDATFGQNGGRATKWSAEMLEAKIDLWRSNWAKVRTETEDIINQSPHKLLNKFGDVFRSSNERNDEIIFATEYLADVKGSSNPTQARPRVVEEKIENPGWFNGVGNYTLLESFAETFVPDDARKNYCVLREVNGHALNFIYDPKMMDVPEPVSDPLTTTASPRANSGKDHIWMRLADTYLMLAEAENELDGPTQIAYAAINKVRSRVNLPDLENLSHEEFRQAVREERSRELLGEFFGRKLDLIRWGILVKTIQELPAKEAAAIAGATNLSDAFKTKVMFDLNNQAQLISKKNTVLPIPADEIAKDPNLEQNTLWK